MGLQCEMSRVEETDFRIRIIPSELLDSVQVLPSGGRGREKFTERRSILRRRFLPIFLDRIPPLAEPFLVRIAILRNDHRDPVRMCQRKPQPYRRAVIENVNCEALQ